MLTRLFNKLKNIFRWLLNFSKPTYQTVWTEDLPEKLIRKTIYIVGGKDYPFQAVFLCPRGCSKKIFLNVSNQHKKNERWTITEHKDGTISLHPSIWLKTCEYECHYWIQKGKIIWHFD